MSTTPDTAQDDRPDLQATVRDTSDEVPGTLYARRGPGPVDDPTRPALFENRAPKFVAGRDSSHDLVVESFYEGFDGKVLKGLTGIDRRKIMRRVARDIEDRRDFGYSRYGQYLQPSNGRNTLIDLYQEQLDGLAYAQTLLSESGDSTDPELAEIYRAQLVLTLRTRAYLAKQNGEDVGGGAPAPTSGA